MKQKLSKRTLRNTPTSTSLACSNCGPALNRDESPSVPGLKTLDNNSEVNHHQHRDGFVPCESKVIQNKVYVLDINGNPLMPTSQRNSRRLLKSNKAKVVNGYKGFTIKLNYHCTHYVQPIICKVDGGFIHVGVSVVTETQELFSAEIILDDKTKSRLDEKRMYRRGRRNKLWYRKPRFLNRGGDKKGWLPPSTKRRGDTQIKFVENLRKSIPIDKVIIEIAKFDIAKLENPDIKNWEYQKGNLYEYENAKAFLINREHGKCQLCNKEKGKDTWNIHHIEQKSKSGSDRLGNAALVHEKCHKKIHKSKIELECNKPKQYKDATFMNIFASYIKENTDLETTYGYITYIKRRELGLPKSHINDAFAIANGNSQTRCKSYMIVQKHRNNRAIQMNRKGRAPSIRRCRYSIQPNDLVEYNKKQYFASGVSNCGKTIVLKNIPKNINAGIKNIKEIFHFGSLVWNLGESAVSSTGVKTP